MRPRGHLWVVQASPWRLQDFTPDPKLLEAGSFLSLTWNTRVWYKPDRASDMSEHYRMWETHQSFQKTNRRGPGNVLSNRKQGSKGLVHCFGSNLNPCSGHPGQLITQRKFKLQEATAPQVAATATQTRNPKL